MTLQQLCSDEGHLHPEAATTLLNERYVDDVLRGVDDLRHAAYLHDELISLANRRGFPLRKWVTSHDLQVSPTSCWAWSDVLVALSWIRSSRPVGNTLVDNYVNHIQELYQPHLWRYVPFGSRTSWFNGPAWLYGPSSDWPADQDCRTGANRSTVEPTGICAVSVSAPDLSKLDRFSSLT
ncbi:unnamed protein product [Trichogramma brassicae]|uniref:Uncharacterized protein n=1 Tax=Trichogramma brassicae TaxID=86971 RepID=A0A6H5IGN8_9HYME|nr:unnamed protein product [Trichogramma brassicae]